MSCTKYLTYEKSRGRYVFQIRVPLDVAAAFGNKTMIRTALGRIDETEAVQRAAELAARWLRKFDVARRRRAPMRCGSKQTRISLALDDDLMARAVATRRLVTFSRLQKTLAELREKDDEAWDRALDAAALWVKTARRNLSRAIRGEAGRALEEIADAFAVDLKQSCDVEAFADLINEDSVVMAEAWLATLNGEESLERLRPKPSELLPLVRFFGTAATVLVDAWKARLGLVGKEARPKTVAKYSSIAAEFADVMGETPVEMLNAVHVRALTDVLRARENRAGTIVDKLTTLISLLKPISPDAAACCRAMLPRTSLGRAKRLPLTVEQLCRVRELVAADVGRDDADDLMLLDLMTLTGARLGELMQLRASDVSKHDDMWHINIGGDAMLKTDNAYRTLPVSTCHNPELERWLIRRALGGVGESPLFVDARPDAFGHLGAAESKRLNRIIRTLYVDRRIVLESVRNTVARTMRAEGVDPRVRRAMLGHADLDIHETHYDPEGLMTVEDFMPVVPVLEALAARVRGARPAAS